MTVYMLYVSWREDKKAEVVFVGDKARAEELRDQWGALFGDRVTLTEQGWAWNDGTLMCACIIDIELNATWLYDSARQWHDHIKDMS